MADIESNIDININAGQAISAIKQLQAQLSGFYQDLSKSGAKAAREASDLQNKLINSINATGKFSASIKTVSTTTESFTDALEKNKLSLGQYFKFGASQVTGFRKIFSTEFDTIDKVARERVKTLQTQYIKLGRDANGAMKAISVRPLQLDMSNLGTQVAMTAQKQQIFNEVLKQGSTNLLNFGKNTQWAGRQLMVGFTIPLSIFGATAAREFMKIEEQVIRLQRVYGDFGTSTEQTDKMTESIKELALEFTKYGIAVDKTIGLAADAAAMGKQGAELTAQVAEASRLAVLGGVEQAKALETTTSLTNAFGVATDKLAGKINFLNAVENQTVTSIDDLTEAIPKAGPVVQQLGGDVEDLAFFLTAMKEGGINASEGANALKSGLASMLNPAAAANDQLTSFGINLKGIMDANQGDVVAQVVEFGRALDGLGATERAQAIESLFGKFQFARMSTLFQNVIAEGSQANRVLQLTRASTEELAVLSEREMKRVQDSPMYQFQGAVERFQAALAPIGETFLKAVTPIINFGTDLLNKFNELGDGAKQFWTILVAAVAGLGPVLLMTFGLIANGAANIMKLFGLMGGFLKSLSGQSQMLGGSTQYMSQEQLEAAAVAASLNQVHQDLIQTFTAESTAANQLAAAYRNAAQAAAGIATRMVPGGATATPKKYADGVFSVPGPKGAGDVVPAMLSPGEAVIPSDKADKYRGLIQGIIAGNIPGFVSGTDSAGTRGSLSQQDRDALLNAIGIAPDSSERIRMPLSLPERRYSVSGVMAPTSVNSSRMADGSPIGMTSDYLSSDIGKAALFATLQTELESLSLSTERVTEVLDLVGPDVEAAINSFDDTIEGWQTAAARATIAIDQNAALTEQEKKALQRRMLPDVGSDSDFPIGSKPEVEISRGRMRSRDDRENEQGQYGSRRQREILKSKFPDRGEEIDSMVFAHLPGSESILGDVRQAGPISVGSGDNRRELTSDQSALLEQKRSEIEAAKIARSTREGTATANAEWTAYIEEKKRLAGPEDDSFVISRDRNSPHELASKDGADDAEAYIESSKQVHARENRRASTGGNVTPGVSVGPPPIVTTPRKQPTLVTGERAMTNVENATYSGMRQSGMLSGSTGNSRLDALAAKFDGAMTSGTEKLKAKFPKYADSIDDLTRSLQRKLDFDGSFAAQEDAARQRAIDAQQKLTDAITARAARVAAGEAGVPDINERAILGDEEYANLMQQRNRDEREVIKESKRQKRAQLAGRVGMGGAIATTALGAMTAVGGPVGEFAQNAMPWAAGLSTVLPMLISMGPVVGTLVGVLGLTVAGFIALNVAQDDARKKGLELAQSMGVGSEAIKKFATAAGKATAGEVRDKQRQNQMSPFAVQSGEKTFGQSYMESEEGKQKLKDVQAATKEYGSEQAAQNFASQLAASVATEALSVEQARSIAANVGIAMEDRDFVMNVIADVNSMVGMDGKKAKNGAIDLKVNLIEDARSKISGTNKAVQKYKEDQMSALNPDELANANTAALDLTAASYSSGIIAGEFQNVLSLTQELVDANDVYYQKLIDAEIAIGNIGKAEELNTQRLKDKQALLDQQKLTYEEIDKYVKSADYNDVQMFEAQKTAIAKRYEGDSLMQAKAKEAADKVKDSRAIDETRQVQILAAMETGSLDPDMANQLVKWATAGETDTVDKVMNLLATVDTEMANQIMQLSDVFADDPDMQATFITRFEGATLEDQEKYLNSFSLLRQMALSDEDLQLTMEFYNDPNNKAALDRVTEDINEINKVKDITLTMASEIVGVDPAYLADYAEYFDSLPENQQKTFTSIFTSIYQEIGDRKNSEAYQTWRQENGMGKGAGSEAEYIDYAKETTKNLVGALSDVTTAQAEDANNTETASSGGGGGGRQSSVLDDLLQKLRRLQMSALGLTEGWKGAREALDALFPAGQSNSPFQGIEQQMRSLGAKEDLITLIAGMDPEEFQKRKDELFTFDGAGNIAGFRDSLLSIGAAFRSINLGNFQNEQQKSIATINDQNTAIRKLIANGYSMADAYEMVQDAAFASAVAQETNNEIIKQATADYEKATKQATLFAAAQAAATANKDTASRVGTIDFINANSGNLSNAVIEEMLNNKEFATLMMSPNLSQEQRDALQQWIDNIENSAEIDLEANLTNISGMEKVFEDGFSKAMEAFSAQEKKIDLEFEVKRDPFERTVQNAQNLIADIQNKPGGMDDLQADLERIGNQEEDINKRYQKRLDALNEIKKNNDRINQQKKAELSVADALTQGDIAAAARAIEDARAQQAQANMQSQQDLLQRQKEAELEALTGQMGLTKEQIELRLRDLKQEVLNIEESMIEPAQYQLSLLDRQAQRQKEALTVLGMTRREWETLNNRIQVAKTSSTEYKKAMEDARDVVGKIVEYWTEIQKPKTTVHTIITVNETRNSGGGANVGASGDGGGGGNGNGSQPNPATANDTTGALTPYPNKLGTRYRNAMGSSFAKSSAGASWASNVRSKYNSWMNAENKSPGGTAAMSYAAALGTYLKSSGYNAGGLVAGMGNTDKIRAMLTPGEFVITKPAVNAYGAAMMKDINNGTFQSGSVYNYSINVKVDTDADANQIANAVMAKIKGIDSKRIQGNRF